MNLVCFLSKRKSRMRMFAFLVIAGVSVLVFLLFKILYDGVLVLVNLENTNKKSISHIDTSIQNNNSDVLNDMFIANPIAINNAQSEIIIPKPKEITLPKTQKIKQISVIKGASSALIPVSLGGIK